MAAAAAAADEWPLMTSSVALHRQHAITFPLRQRSAGTGFVFHNYDPALTTTFSRYAHLMELRVNPGDKARKLEARCLVHGCTKSPPWTLLATEPGAYIDMGNFLKHLRAAHIDVMLIADQTTAAGAGAGAGAGAPRGEKRAHNEPIVLVVDAADQRVFVTELILATGLPLSFVENLAFRLFCSRFRIDTFSRRTLGSEIAAMSKKLVWDPIAQRVEEALAPVVLYAGGARLVFKRKVFIGTDGATDRAGRSMVSFTLGAAKISQGLLARPQLRPEVTPIALEHWVLPELVPLAKPAAAAAAAAAVDREKYSADAQGKFMVKVISKVGLTPGSVLALVMDTTNLQPATAESPAFEAAGVANLSSEMKAPHSAPPTTGAGATPCSQHKDSLVGQDQRTNDEFLRACTACHNIAKWIKASDDRVQKLLAMMVLMIAAGLLQGVPKGPILPPETRFLFNLVMMERMLELIAALE